MFLSLSIKNSFLPKDLKLEFEDGLNIIVGKNNSGKSTTIEMLNYVLFGSAALRSSVSDYSKTFEVEAIVQFSDSIYKINRTPKSSDIYLLNLEDKTYNLICTGISSVNSFVKDLLSYDYKIFSLTNYCKQHDLLNLTSCTPQALVSLIEVVSGLEDSYRLMSELKALKKEYKTKHKTLSDYERFANKDISFQEDSDFEKLLESEPEVLENFKQVTLNLFDTYNYTNNLMSDLRSKRSSFEANQSTIANLVYNYPDKTKEELVEKRQEILNLRSQIAVNEKSLKDFVIPENTYEESYLVTQEALIQKNLEYKNFVALQQKLEAHKVTCPECEHDFSPGMSLDPVLEEEFKVAPEVPQMSRKDILNQRQWNTRKESFDALVATQEALKTTLDSYSEFDLSKIDVDLESYAITENYQKIMNIFEVNLGDFYKDNKSIFLDKLEILPPNCDDYSVFFRTAIVKVGKLYADSYSEYEASLQIKESLSTYINNKREYLKEKETLEELTGLLEDAEEKENTSNLLYQVLIDTKKEIQKLSLPVLNSIASNILSDITGGERNKVEITEGFKIEVDSTDVNVIEGSAQVITNLSLRIALLNTFYKDNFLVCLFDEIDESLHEDRFEYMEECFNRLANSGYQIIAVSHKDYSSGNIINLHEVNSDD